MTDFWAEVEKLLDPVNPPKIFYRLYYDDQGCPLFYSMEDLPGNYIDIDADTFAHGPTDIRVRAGKLVKVTQAGSKLVPQGTGTMCHLQDVSIVTTSGQRWTMKNYESKD